jgi:Phage integrase, N-terminal SAM-like domain
VEPTKLMLAAFIEDEWLPAVRRRLRPSTHESYASVLRNHAIPRLGGAAVQQITPPALTAMYGDLLDSGLSARTVRYIHTIVNGAFADGVKWGRMTRNPAADAEPPPRGQPSSRRCEPGLPMSCARSSTTFATTAYMPRGGCSPHHRHEARRAAWPTLARA